ncbi:MAG: hypothetical protein VKN72_22390 [Nostocales cyanobacterium 94392]|nr:hypothetical protein [Nostocales cyanobacterium 94392]
MSEQLTFEILKEKFKGAEEGEFYLLCTFANLEVRLIDIGINCVYYRHTNNGAFGYISLSEFLKHWKIKQPKDEYEVFYLHDFTYWSSYGDLRLDMSKHKNSKYKFKIMRNKRTGEIVEYNEKLITKD